MSYPASVVGFTTHNSGDKIASADINNIQTEVVALETALLSSGLSHLVQANGLRTQSPTTLTCASHVISATLLHHTVDTQGGAGADTLNTINLGSVSEGIALGVGSLLLLTPANTAHVVTVKHGLGNIHLVGAADYAMSDAASALLLRYDGTNWIEISRCETSSAPASWPTWTALAKIGNWADYGSGFAGLQYRQDPTGKLVYLMGLVKNSAGETGVTHPIATLPVGYRPTDEIIVTGAGNFSDDERPLTLSITAAGNIYVRSTTALTTGPDYVSLNGIVFATDQ